MRCFPHCCPGHRDRSYCGSPLHVRIFSDFLQAHIDNRLVVYCRFRPVHIKSLSIGDCISIEAIRSSLQSVDPSTGQWIESRRVPLDPKSIMFEIHPDCGRWFYPWGGVATVAMRSTQHVFEAVVFYHMRDSLLEVVTQTSSPAFRLKSFRRSETSSSKQLPSTEKDFVGRPPALTAQRRETTRVASPWIKTVGEGDGTQATRHWLPRGISVARFESREAQPVIPPATPSTPNALESVLRWLQKQPASSAGAGLMLKWQDIVQDACTAQVEASTVGGGLVPILSALESAVSRPSTQRPECPLDLFDTTVSVLLNEWLSVESSRASTRATTDLVRNSVMATRDTHRRWLSDAVARAQWHVHSTTQVSWSQILAMVSRVESMGQLSTSVVDGSEFSFRSFEARYRERVMHQHKSQRRLSSFCGLKSRRSDSLDTHHDVPVGLANSAPVWTSRIEDAAIELATIDSREISLLTIVQFWKHLSCLRLDFAPASPSSHMRVQLSVASVFNTLVSDGSFTKLTLDGQYRWFNCLPSGEPTVGTTLMGYVVGDYVGRATSAGTIHITTYLWSATAENANATAFAWHWTMDAASLTSSGSSSSVVSVVVESASLGRSPHAMETMSMAEKLRCVGRWQHACELQFTYRIMKRHPHRLVGFYTKPHERNLGGESTAST